MTQVLLVYRTKVLSFPRKEFPLSYFCAVFLLIDKVGKAIYNR